MFRAQVLHDLGFRVSGLQGPRFGQTYRIQGSRAWMLVIKTIVILTKPQNSIRNYLGPYTRAVGLPRFRVQAIVLIRKPKASKSGNYGRHLYYVGDTCVVQGVCPLNPRPKTP